ncbi:unnamed protein product [Schistosoma margrebowiei]|uniref:Uncharacterized protein n=1 Tax=Schistosoma margrebowiei TaxID=48269 RepID=A0A183MJG5_9TREM|nr:unnamed protein product [Schistosoma margrebowiei]
MKLEDPHKKVIRSFHRSSSDGVTVDVAVGGIYKVSYSDSFKFNLRKKMTLEWYFHNAYPYNCSRNLDFTLIVVLRYLQVCFSNYFSSISHKIVSMMWHNSSSNPPESPSLSGVSTQISESLYNLHATISKAITQQFESRLLLTRSYSNAIFLHYRVLYWSLGQALVIILFGIGQVLVMRSFFTSPSNQRSAKPIPMSNTPLHTVSF